MCEASTHRKWIFMRDQMIPGDIIYEIHNESGDGYLTVNRPHQTEEWQLVDILVFPERRGLGKKLIRKFCSDHEIGTKVYGHIGHKESLSTVASLDQEAHPKQSRTITLFGVNDIHKVPIFSFLENSGIVISEVEILYDCSLTEYPQISMSYKGETK